MVFLVVAMLSSFDLSLKKVPLDNCWITILFMPCFLRRGSPCPEVFLVLMKFGLFSVKLIFFYFLSGELGEVLLISLDFR